MSEVPELAPRSAFVSFCSKFGRAVLGFLARWGTVLIALVWLVLALTIQFYQFGLDPLIFPAQDEAVVRLAAQLIRDHGQPFLSLPFPDPEDLAHPRLWLSTGNVALPFYAPVLLYGYGFLLRLHAAGLFVIALIPAAAVAAFAAGTARLLPVSRRWLALFAPMLGFASLYWILRPWMNLSPVLAALCWAFFFTTHWLRNGRRRWLFAALLSVGLAGAVRPDYAGFLLLSALLLLIAHKPSEWRAVIGFTLLAGLSAVVPNLILNKALTGHALRAVYQLALDRQYGADTTHGLDSAGRFPGLSVLKVLFIPMGFPALPVLESEFRKYFIGMGPTPVLVLAQVALIARLRKRPWRSLALHLAVLVLCVGFVVTHLHKDLWGGEFHLGFVFHSVPRYLAPIFLFLPLSPLLVLGDCRRMWAFVLGTLFALGVATSCAYELAIKQPSSFKDVRKWVGQHEVLLEGLSRKIPESAIVYSTRSDKVLWSRWRVGVFEDPTQTATSMVRAAAAELPVYLLQEPRAGRSLRQLMAALERKQFKLTRVDARRGLYRLDRLPPPLPNQ